MEGNYRPVRRSDLIWSEVDGEILIVTSDGEFMHHINEIGSRIWNLIDGKSDINKIASIISEEYEEDRDIVWKELLGFLEILGKLEVLENMHGDKGKSLSQDC